MKKLIALFILASCGSSSNEVDVGLGFKVELSSHTDGVYICGVSFKNQDTLETRLDTANVTYTLETLNAHGTVVSRKELESGWLNEFEVNYFSNPKVFESYRIKDVAFKLNGNRMKSKMDVTVCYYQTAVHGSGSYTVRMDNSIKGKNVGSKNYIADSKLSAQVAVKDYKWNAVSENFDYQTFEPAMPFDFSHQENHQIYLHDVTLEAEDDVHLLATTFSIIEPSGRIRGSDDYRATFKVEVEIGATKD